MTKRKEIACCEKEVREHPTKKIKIASTHEEASPNEEQERQIIANKLNTLNIAILRNLYESVEEEIPLSVDLFMNPSLKNVGSVIDNHNAAHKIDPKTVEGQFLNSWHIKYYPDELMKLSIETKSSHDVLHSGEFEKAKKNIEEADHGSTFSFISQISQCHGISERTIHSYTVGFLIVRALEQVIPKVFIIDCDQKYDCPTIELHLQENRAQLATKAKHFLRADITLELSEAFTSVFQNSLSPIYVLTVEVQRSAMGSNIFAHKDFMKVCFEMRFMLKHIIENLSLSSEAAKKLELYGILAGSDGLCILSISTEIVSEDQENAVHYRLQHSNIYKYNEPADMKACLVLLWEIGYRVCSYWSQFKPAKGEDDFKWMNSAKAKKISTTAAKRTYPNINPSTEYYDSDIDIATVTRSEVLRALRLTPLFEQVCDNDVKTLKAYLSTIAHRWGQDTRTELALLALMRKHIVALVQSPKGDCYVFGEASFPKSIVVWLEDDQEMCVTATHIASAPRALSFNLPDDQSDNEESNTKDDASHDFEPPKSQTKQPNPNNDNSSNTGTNSSVPCSQSSYYCSIQRIERKLNLVKVSVLEKTDRTYAFMVMRPEGRAFAKISLGESREKTVMARIKELNHVNISKVYSHFEINLFPDWMKTMVETYDVAPLCYVTITEPLIAYDDYFDRSFRRLSVSQQKKVICRTFKGILQGLKQTHSVGVLHHDLSLSNVMFRLAGTTLKNHEGGKEFELCDPVLIDFNFGRTFEVGQTAFRWITYGTKPFAARKIDTTIGPMNDLFSVGVVFAHYARLVITNTEWFMPVPDEEHYMDYIDEIGRYISGDSLPKYFGSDFAALFARLVSGLLAKMEERLGLQESLTIVNEMIRLAETN